MIPPGEIITINHRGTRFKAHPSYRCNAVSSEMEYLYNPAKATFQYRIEIPGILISLITIDVTERELLEFVNSGKPVRIKPVE